MTKTPRPRLLGPLAVLVTAAGLAGCSSYRYDNTFAAYDPHRSRTRAVLDAQYAKGAADDAILHEGHFRGEMLSGVGCDKLARMGAGLKQGDVMVVWMKDGSEEGSSEHAARVEAIREFLLARGMTEEAVEVRVGQPEVSSSASHGLTAMQKMRTGSTSPAPADARPAGTPGLFGNLQ